MFQPFLKSGNIEVDLPLLVAAQQALADLDSVAMLANSSSLLNWYLDDINWVGFYLWNEDDANLVLGPFQGLPACIRISEGQGVCGIAVERRKTQIVEDVRLFPGHIACDSASLSELVIPLFRGQKIIGVLDIDSPRTGRFTTIEAEALEEYCRNLVDLLPA